ncbi:MAG: DNA-directed RNA polymerase subunit K [Candidatus Pacearchaeota archaeon]
MEKYTKYEKARILGARALQLAMNAPLLLNIPKEKLEEMNYDPLKIAEYEFNAGVLPITVKRPFPAKEEAKEELAEELEEEIIKEEVSQEEKKEEIEKTKEIKREEEEEEEETEEEILETEIE